MTKKDLDQMGLVHFILILLNFNGTLVASIIVRSSGIV